MKKKLSEQFLPYNYTQQLYQTLHNLKQIGTVEEYGDKFYQLIARIDLMESEKQLVARFISGLKVLIQDLLVLHICYTLSQAYNRALMVEKQLVRRTQSSNYSHKPNSHLPPISTPSQQANSGIYNRGVPKNCSGSNFKSVLTFKCGEMGHKANECNKLLLSTGQALILEHVVEVEEVGESDSDELVRGDDEEELKKG